MSDNDLDKLAEIAEQNTTKPDTGTMTRNNRNPKRIMPKKRYGSFQARLRTMEGAYHTKKRKGIIS